MNELFLLFPIFFPIVGSVLVWYLKIENTRLRNILYEIIVVIGAASVWALILNRPDDALTVYHFTDYFSITFELDGFGSLFAGMSSALWVFAMIYAFSYMEHEERPNNFMCCYVITFGVTMGICFAASMITMFVFYEMLTLITIPLVVHKYDHESMYAGRKYALYSFGGSAFAFIGIVVLGVFAGGTTFALGGYAVDITGIGKNMLLLIYVMTFFGFGVKACVFPLHAWLPVASVAPTPVTALLHAVAVVKAGVFAIIRLTHFSFGADFLTGTWAQSVVQIVVMFTVLFAAAKAVKERHFKRRLAYSTVSNLSYILIGVTLMTPAGLAAGMCHMLFHAIVKIAAFYCAGAVLVKMEREYIWELDGIGKVMPVTFACFTASALSLTGIPLFCGFVSKWQLCTAALASGTVLGYASIATLIMSSFLCALYMFNVVIRAFFPKRERDHFIGQPRNEASVKMLIPMCLFSVVNIVFGLFGQTIIDLTTNIAQGLF